MDEQQLARKAEVAELLLHAARELGETLDPERVYQRFHELLGDVVPHDGVVVSSYEERDDLIRCEFAWVEGNVLDPGTLPALPLNRSGGGMQSRVIVSGEPLLFNDVGELVETAEGVFYNVDRDGALQRIPSAGAAGTTAALMVPVKHDGRVVGVVQVMTDHGSYSGEQLEVVEGLVAQMAASVRNARLQSERRRLEAAEAAALAVAAERELAAQVLEAVGTGVFLLDPDGVVRLWNRAAADATGLAADAVVGCRLGEAVPEWDAVAAAVPVSTGDVSAPPVTVPLEVGGRDLWLSVAAVATAAGVVYAFRDVTGERRLDEEKNDLIATISHELRTPLAAVYGAAETLLRRDIDLGASQGRQLLEMIARQATRLARITGEVLLTRNLDRGEVHFEHDVVDVAEVVAASVEAIGAQYVEPVALEVALPADAPAAYGDAGRIQQVLVNLLDNALKYGGGTPVAVRLAGDESRVTISVADAGPGVLPTDVDRIFEKFVRADPQLRNAPGGTGLGLYIARELAQRMGGSLDVRSAPGRGATFVLQLPRAPAGAGGAPA
jgi:two-component system phosphate regulon sensor histidine kinase PhoR